MLSVKEETQSDLVGKLEAAQKLYVEANRMEAAIAEKEKISAEVEQMKKELRRNLENEAMS